MDEYFAIIIGAGPAGIAAAINAADRGRKRVLLLEHMPNPGRKLLVSGSGKCNVTNILSPGEMAADFGSKERFVRPALYAFSSQNCCDFFNNKSTTLEVTDGFHYFPVSKKAADILNCLLKEAENCGVELKTRCRAEKLLIKDNSVCGVNTSSGKFYAQNVLIATGGKSYQKLGSTGIGYILAKQAGHDIVTPLPALTGIHTAQQWCRECAGISLQNCSAVIDIKGEKVCGKGELLFTSDGVSAFCITNISGRISQLLCEYSSVPLKINLFADKDYSFWIEFFNGCRKNHGAKSVGKLLEKFLPHRLIPFICPQFTSPAARFTANDAKMCAQNISALKIDAISCGTLDRAVVTRGGVNTNEVDPKTLQSKIIKGLFFAGEVLDVDGPCGGYNIQWALSSGFSAGFNKCKQDCK